MPPNMQCCYNARPAFYIKCIQTLFYFIKNKFKNRKTLFNYEKKAYKYVTYFVLIFFLFLLN